MSENELPGLTDQQELFVEHYLRTWCAKSAAEAAGYQHPKSMGWQLKQKPQIESRIRERIEQARVSADEVLLHLAGVLRFRPTAYLTIDLESGKQVIDLDRLEADGLGHLVEGFGYDRKGNLEVKFSSKLRAAELLGKHHGLFTDRVEHSGPGGGPLIVREVVVELPADDDDDSPSTGAEPLAD